MVRAVAKFSTTRPHASPLVEIWADVLDEVRPKRDRAAKTVGAEVALERDDRAEEATQERAALDADAHRKMAEALEQAVKDGILTAEIARALALKHLHQKNAREVALALDLTTDREYEALRRQLNLALKRLGGGARQRAHGRKPRGG